jgi:hypothetical protein
MPGMIEILHNNVRGGCCGRSGARCWSTAGGCGRTGRRSARAATQTSVIGAKFGLTVLV